MGELGQSPTKRTKQTYRWIYIRASQICFYL